MDKLKVGLIGCGAMGTEIARAIAGRLGDRYELSAVCDVDADRVAAIRKVIGASVPAADMAALVGMADLVVEAASAKVSASVLDACVKAGKAVMIMSVGGILESEALLDEAKRKRVPVMIPSGAISGIDALKSASAGRIESVTLTTTKPPKGLAGAPYLAEKGIDVGAIKTRTVIFEGPAAEAVKLFPQNVNVSAVLSLAGIGARRTVVRIVADPSGTANVHEIEITGECGRISTKTENVPSGANPKTSALAINSAIAALLQYASSVRIGT
jgi:aspartate dehydrogenase